jgi:lysyl-tRNA synthetase, class II
MVSQSFHRRAADVRAFIGDKVSGDRRPLLGGLARAAVLALVIVAATSLATGWLYWARASVASWPGPRVLDALPLDELASHGNVPLFAYLLIVGCAGVLIGLAARVLRIGRAVAGVGVAVGTGVWMLLIDMICLSVVRQVPFGVALPQAVGLQAVYLSAAICGAAAATLAVEADRNTAIARLVCWGVAAGGVINLLAALFPSPGSGGRAATGGAVVAAAHVLMVPVGVLLLVGWRAVARGNRRALHVIVPLLGLSVLLQLARGPDYAAAIAECLIVVTVLAGRNELRFAGDPAARPLALRRLGGMLVLAVLYGIAAIWIYRTAAGLPFRLGTATADTFRALAALPPRSARYPGGEFSHWFRFSVLLIAAIGVAWAAEVWVRPWHQRLRPDAWRRGQATERVSRFGQDTLSPFTLRSDKDWFILGPTLIAYRVVRGVALMSGDPIGPADSLPAALTAFVAHAHEHGWTVAVLGASDEHRAAYADRGFHWIYHGDESIVDIQAFSLDGRAKRTIRQAANRLDRQKFTAEVVLAGDVPPELRAELSAVEGEWLAGRRRTGFTMELDSLFRIGGADEVFVIGRDPGGAVAGFLHLAVCRASTALTLSSMPRRAGTPNGLTAWLVVRAIEWAKERDYAQLSLNFSPFARLLSPGARLSRWQRLARCALLRLKRVLALQLDNLLRFNQQFGPESVPRYLVVEKWADVPGVAVAAMAAEGYLPSSRLIRGRDWVTAPTGLPGPGDESGQAGGATLVAARPGPEHAATRTPEPGDAGPPDAEREDALSGVNGPGLRIR